MYQDRLGTNILMGKFRKQGVFPAGETEKEIRIGIMTDTLPEPNENFCVSLSSPEGGASLGKVNMAVRPACPAQH